MIPVPVLIGLCVTLFLGALIFGVMEVRKDQREDMEWRQASEARMAPYLGETVIIAGVPHTVISAHAFPWSKQCLFRVKAYDKETEIPEATVIALLAKAAKVEK